MKKTMYVVALALMMMGVLVALSPSVTHADPITITQVCVTVGAGTYSNTGATGCGPAGPGATGTPWSFGPGVSLAPGGGTLLLSQNAAFNFDTSDNCLNPPVCTGATIVVKGFTPHGTFTDTFLDGAGPACILCFGISDTNPATKDEAHAYSTKGFPVIVGASNDLSLNIGYADTAHNFACLDTAGPTGTETPGNCFPDPFTANTVIASAAGTTTADCQKTGFPPPCFDAGVLLFTNNQRPVPEPASMLLLGAGLLGLTVWRGRHRRSEK